MAQKDLNPTILYEFGRQDKALIFSIRHEYHKQFLWVMVTFITEISPALLLAENDLDNDKQCIAVMPRFVKIHLKT